MAKPRQADRVVEVAYAIAMAVNIIVSVVGYLMYGTEVSDEVRSSPTYASLSLYVTYWIMRLTGNPGQQGSSSNSRFLAHSELVCGVDGRSEPFDQAPLVASSCTSPFTLVFHPLPPSEPNKREKLIR